MSDTVSREVELMVGVKGMASATTRETATNWLTQSLPCHYVSCCEV